MRSYDTIVESLTEAVARAPADVLEGLEDANGTDLGIMRCDELDAAVAVRAFELGKDALVIGFWPMPGTDWLSSPRAGGSR